ncbi:hypothetical protein Bhyg_10672 [Pseudolycoriella hygida]|uniref:G-patch domain-containing protein n=1 Tax=Pseudolycoriella hygida TaxID=35572 RepID=A0A9Q0MTY6_9DIPT|nr:hypothetical protein Bhyg_10672 [Pseudolycoriella hygida]
MEDSLEWKLLKMCSDAMELIVTSSVTYSKNDHFCSVVIDGLLIAATTGDNLFNTIKMAAEKAVRKIKHHSYDSRFEKEHYMGQRTEINSDLDKEYRHFFPLFQKYIINSRKRTDLVSGKAMTKLTRYSDANASFPANWTWDIGTKQHYHPNYFLTKNYTTTSSNCVKVKIESGGIKVVKRKMLLEQGSHIDESNIGYKMLLGLGWSGGPLGPKHDGIAEPISVELRTRRSGLGCTDSNINNQIIFQYLKQYADDDQQLDQLEFSDDFSNKEKKKLFG